MNGDPELEKFKTAIGLRVYAAQQGYARNRKDSWAGSAVMRHANNDKIVIKRDADGHWVYFSVRSPDGSDSGTIIDFIKQRLGLSVGATRKELRAFMGLPESTLPTYPPLPKVAKDRIRVERAFARTRVAHELATRVRFLIREQLDWIADVAVHIEPFLGQESPG